MAPLQLKNLDIAINRGSDWWVFDKRRLCVDTIVRSPDGSWLALGGGIFTGEAILGVGTRKGFAILWDVRSDGIKRQWEFDGSVSSLDFSPDGSTLAIAGYCTLELWDVKTEERRLVFEDQQSEISYARFSRDGNLLATGAMNGRVGLWDTMSRAATRCGHPSSRCLPTGG